MDQGEWDARYREKGFLWTAEPNGFLVGAVEGFAPGKALDLAAGEGRNAVWLAQQGWEVDAVDWSDVALDKGRELARHAGVSVWFTREDLRSWWPPTDTYDLVVIAYLQVPYIERHGVWRAAAGAVASGGRLVVIGHDSENLTRGYGGPQQEEVLYSAEEAATVIGENLDVVSAEQVTRQVETDDGVREAIDNMVIAVRK
jgi:SAM-dependent methyltransferase